MTAPQLFQYKSKNVRTVFIDGEPWFVVKDVCAALDIINANDAVSRLDDEDGVGTTDLIDSMGRKQRAKVVNEFAVYELAFQSRKDEAKAFRRWVTRDVLPSIRKTGSYNSSAHAPIQMDWNDPVFQRHLLESGLANLNRVGEVEKQLAIVAPKAEAYDAFIVNNSDSDRDDQSVRNDYSIRTAAQLLFNLQDVKFGQNQLFEWLRENKWIDQKNQPLQDKLRLGLMRLKVRNYIIPETGMQARPQARITPKGLDSLRRALLNEQSAPAAKEITEGCSKRSISSAPDSTVRRVRNGRERRTLSPISY